MSGAPQSRGAGAGTGTPERSRTLAVLRFAVVLTAVLFFTVPLTSAGGVLGAVAGTTGGTLLGLRLARGRLRLAAVALAGLALALGGTLAAALATGSTLLPALVGPTGALQLAELLRWFLLTMAVVGALRFASARHPGLALLEVILAISCLALALSAHRDGAFHRPLELGDWAWSRGIDPARLLLALGALAGLGLTPLLLGEALGRHGRNLLSLVLLALGLLLLASRMPLPASRRPDAAGLRGEGEDGDRQRRPREGGRGSGQGDEGRGLTGPTPARPGDGGDAAGDLPREGAGSAGRGGDGGQPSAPPPSVADQFPFQDEVSNDGSESAVAVVVFHDDHHPANGFYYFRQVAFSQYNGRRMVRTTRDDADGDLFDGFPVLRKELELPESATWHDRVRTTVALLADHRQPFGLVAPRSLEGLPNPQAGRFVRTYRVVSVVIRSSYQEMLLAPAGEDGWSSALLSHYTALPADPRYRALAEEVTALLSAEFADLPLPRALAIKRWLDQHVTYSHRSKHAGADDPVASFLFGDRTGYCIHIAHAAVYLLRSLGVPARVGAGYTVDEAHAGGGSSLLLRGGNAHAWPELYLRGFGWVVVDPTPERSEEPSLAPPDSVQQRMLGEMARSQQQGKGAGQAQQPDPREGPWDLLSLLYLLPWALLAAMLALLLLLYAVKLWRRAAPALRGGPELTRIAYRAASDRLAELGWRRRVGEPRPSFARRVERLSPAYLPLSEACEAACLGWPRPAQPEMLVRDLLRRQAGELDAAFPRWRRLLGLLDPTSWLRTR